MMFKHRLNSYSSWPPQIAQTKQDLAHAGLFYSNVSDRVTCFACGVMLYGWKIRDDPWIEHYNHVRDCFYLNMVGGVRLVVHDRPIAGTNPDKREDREWRSPPSPRHESRTHERTGIDEPDDL